MSPEAQRIAIAEWCGVQISPCPCGVGHINFSEVPDYLNDLNAMHEAEKKLDVGQWHTYLHTVHEIIEDWRSPLHTSAAQRAEALLRTIGKWVD